VSPPTPKGADDSATRPAQLSKPLIPKATPWYRTLRAEPPLQIRLAIAGGFLAFLLFLWWFITRGEPTEAIISPSKLPSPGAVLGSFSSLSERHLGDSIVSTLTRVFEGVALAALVGISLGVVAGSLRAVSAALGPIVIFLRSIPMGAMLPLMLVLFATGEKQKVMFIFFAVVPFVFSDTMKAVASVPERFVETAKTLGASNRQILQKVLVPLALPDIITSLRFQFGLALGYIMLAEAIDTPSGIGRLLNDGERRGLIENNYLMLFIIALLAFAIDLTIRTLQRGLFPYRKDL
jgi:ABC-type nitrate/sulfonate/bicarbonate transport system permease component